MPDLVGGTVRSAMRRLCRKQGRSAAVIAHRGRFHCAGRLDMVAARGRRRGCCGGKRYHERGSQVSWVWQAMVAGLAAGILALCLSQSALAQTAPRPSKPDEAAHKPATQKGLTQTPATQGAVPKPSAAAQPGRPPDLVYGAFQRGYFLTAFALATNRVTNAADAKAMTLLGELYANGLGVAQDDQRRRMVSPGGGARRQQRDVRAGDLRTQGSRRTARSPSQHAVAYRRRQPRSSDCRL